MWPDVVAGAESTFWIMFVRVELLKVEVFKNS